MVHLTNATRKTKLLSQAEIKLPQNQPLKKQAPKNQPNQVQELQNQQNRLLRKPLPLPVIKECNNIQVFYCKVPRKPRGTFYFRNHLTKISLTLLEIR